MGIESGGSFVSAGKGRGRESLTYWELRYPGGSCEDHLGNNAWLGKNTMYDGEDVGVCQRVTLMLCTWSCIRLIPDEKADGLPAFQEVGRLPAGL